MRNIYRWTVEGKQCVDITRIVVWEVRENGEGNCFATGIMETEEEYSFLKCKTPLEAKLWIDKIASELEDEVNRK